MSYQPRPIDVGHIELTPEILALTERLAENAHDLWGEKRLAEGWTLGPKKDGDLKQTPLLVPYADLPESEKRIRPRPGGWPRSRRRSRWDTGSNRQSESAITGA